MADSRNSAEENTFIKAYEDVEKSKTPIRGPEAFPLLEIVHGPKQGAWFTVAYQKEITLGRAATNSILLEDNSVSRSHAVLQAVDNGFTIRDIGSRNGTFVNEKKIQGEVPLSHLDTIKIGIYTLRYLTEPTEEAFELKEEKTPQVEEMAEPEGTPTEMATLPEPEPEDLEPVTPVEEAVAEARQAQAEAPPPEPASEGPSIQTSLQEDLQAPPTEAGLVPLTEEVSAQKKAGRSAMKSLGILLLVLVILGGGSYAAYRLGAFDKLMATRGKSGKSKPGGEKSTQPVEGKVIKPETPAADGKLLPIFLEVDSVPLPGKVFYKGKELGQTPFKISVQVPPEKPQELSAEIFLDSLGTKITAKESFQVKKQDEVVNVQFKPKLGALNIKGLPKAGTLYLEGKFEGEQAPAKSIQLEDINFDTPVYLPYGKYVAEIKVPETPEGASSSVPTVRYRREFELSEQTGQFEIKASDDSLKNFPAKIESEPAGAELWVDDKKVGETPYDGPLPTGRHQLVLKKEGFNDFEKEINIEMNTPYDVKYNLNTSPAGVYVNKGRQFLKKGMQNEAIEQLAEALKRNPEPGEIAQIHLLLGEAFLQNKTYDQAMAYFQKATESPEFAARAKLGLAESQAGLGQTDQALIQLIDVYLNTNDSKLKSQVESTYKRISPLKSVLYVTSDPAGAQVTINGNPIGQPTPVILSDLLVGSYRIGLSKAGFKAYESRVSLSMSSIKPVVVKLEPEQ